MLERLSFFEKNSLEEIRISLLKYKGYHFIEVRVFSAPQRGEEKVSTPAGFTIPIARFPELKKAILDAENGLMERNLLGSGQKVEI